MARIKKNIFFIFIKINRQYFAIIWGKNNNSFSICWLLHIQLNIMQFGGKQNRE